MACDSVLQQRVESLDDLADWIRPEYVVDAQALTDEVAREALAYPLRMYADEYARDYYAVPHPMVWVTRQGVDDCADTLLTYLDEAVELGLSPEAFHADSLHRLLRQVRQYDFHQGTDVNVSLGRLEFLLTRAYLRYVCGQRFGFVHARKVLNHLLIDPPAPGEERQTTVYRRLYDQRSDEVSDSFVHHAIEEVRHHKLADFLHEVQPTDTLYRLIQAEYRRARTQGDTARARLARINMERARWRYPHPTTGRYVFVNLAAQELTAVDTARDTVATMRVCCGNASHKTPLLHSRIGWVELNPYWVIPQTIVRKEIMPRHVGDSAYFARNRYRAINKATKQEVDPSLLTDAQLRSAQYTLRQDNGVGNSLGRIIFRFPNDFSVFLHDTNNHAAFQYGNRAISHGCVRVERPLELALFFLENPTDFFIDRIRMAIDLPPLSAQGKRFQQNNPDAKPLGRFNFDNPIPVWLDYWTLYPHPRGGFRTAEDNYGYDKVLENILDSY